MAEINIRKGMPSVQLDKAEFKRRFRERFYDPDFEPLRAEIDKIAETAWFTYDEYHKSPRVTKAGPEFADPDYDISVEMARCPDEYSDSGATAEKSQVAVAGSDHQRFIA